jgi:hypothetical protein
MTDDFPQTLFEKIYRRAPSETDRNRLLNVKSGMGLSDNDELWPVIMTLDYYTAASMSGRREILKAVEELPEKIKSTVEGIDALVSERADHAIADAVERSAEKITQIVVRRSQKTEDRISKRQVTVAASIGAVVALLCIVAGAGVGYLLTTNLTDICISETFNTTEGRVGCYIE